MSFFVSNSLKSVLSEDDLIDDKPLQINMYLLIDSQKFVVNYFENTNNQLSIMLSIFNSKDINKIKCTDVRNFIIMWKDVEILNTTGVTFIKTMKENKDDTCMECLIVIDKVLI